MFTSNTTLYVHRPSPTAASFTASNAPTRKTLSARIVYCVTIIARTLISLCVAFALVLRVQSDHRHQSRPLWLDWTPSIFRKITLSSPWEILLPGALTLLFICLRRFHTEESLLILRTLGIQTSTSSRNYLSSSTTRFIPTSQIHDIFIHEAFRGSHVCYYLAVVVKDERELTVVFPTLLPKLDIVEQAWRGARQCLLESTSKA